MSDLQSGTPSINEDVALQPPTPGLPADPPQGALKPTEEGREEARKTLRLFNAGEVRRSLTISVALPSHYNDDYEPWAFVFRVSLSQKIQKQREEWLGLPQKQLEAKEEAQVLDEICDLLADEPTGIGDFPQTVKSPGDKLRDWFNGITDPDYKTLAWAMLRAANNLYWNKISPREFRPKV